MNLGPVSTSMPVVVADDHGDRPGIGSVHALGESGTYAEGVLEGLCHLMVTPEEQQALAAAHHGMVPS